MAVDDCRHIDLRQRLPVAGVLHFAKITTKGFHMTDQQPACLHCQRTSDQVPLVHLVYGANDYYICPQDLPILIHEPQKLTGKLPGVENLTGHEH